MMSRRMLCVLGSLLLALCLPPRLAQGATLATDMNIVNPMRASEAARTALIGSVAGRRRAPGSLRRER